MGTINLNLGCQIKDQIEQPTRTGPVTLRDCFEHESLVTFDDDALNYAFQEWMQEAGIAQLEEWMAVRPEYAQLIPIYKDR